MPVPSRLPEHLGQKLLVCSSSGIPHLKYFPVWVLAPRADKYRSERLDLRLMTIPYLECLGRCGTIKMQCFQPLPVIIWSEHGTHPMFNTPQQDSSLSPSSSMSRNRVDFSFHLFCGLHISYMFRRKHMPMVSVPPRSHPLIREPHHWRFWSVTSDMSCHENTKKWRFMGG
jgi:hypothetical protein